MQLTNKTAACLLFSLEWQPGQSTCTVLPLLLVYRMQHFRISLSIVAQEAVQLKSSRRAGIFGSLLCSIMQDDTKSMCFLA